MNRIEFYKEQYYKELDRRNEINDSLSLPIGLITAFTAGMFYLVNNFNYSYSFILTIVFSVLTAVFLIALIISIIYLIQSYNRFPYRYDYKILSDADKLEAYYQQLQTYYEENPNAPGNAMRKLEKLILSELATNISVNQRNNKKKDKCIYWCEFFLILSFIFLCLSLPVYWVNYAVKHQKKEDNALKMTELDTSQQQENVFKILPLHHNLKQQFTMEKKFPPMPTPPPSQIIREGCDPVPNIPPYNDEIRFPPGLRGFFYKIFFYFSTKPTAAGIIARHFQDQDKEHR